jgi:hypothetical protein
MLSSCASPEEKVPPLFEEIKPDASGVALTEVGDEAVGLLLRWRWAQLDRLRLN